MNTMYIAGWFESKYGVMDNYCLPEDLIFLIF